MDRRQLLDLVGGGTASLLLSSARVARADNQDEKMNEHIKTIGECARACNEAAHHCLERLKEESLRNREHHAKAHELTIDCQAFCVLTASLAARSSPLAKYAHEACAEACRCCAEECEKGQGEVMKACAEKCRDCERVCKQMCNMLSSQERTGTSR
jgi:hypothetical protein